MDTGRLLSLSGQFGSPAENCMSMAERYHNSFHLSIVMPAPVPEEDSQSIDSRPYQPAF